MKRQLFNFFSIFTILLYFISFGTAYSQALYKFEKNTMVPLCDDSVSIKDCLYKTMDASDYIFEGTCIDSKFSLTKDSLLYLEYTYKIHKYFKGKRLDSIVKIYTYIEGEPYYHENQVVGVFLKDNVIWTSPEPGHKGIILANKLVTSVNQDIIDSNIIEFEAVFSINYQLDYKKLEYSRYLGFDYNAIGNICHRKKCVSFMATRDIYDFIATVPNTFLKKVISKTFEKKPLRNNKQIEHKQKKSHVPRQKIKIDSENGINPKESNQTSSLITNDVTYTFANVVSSLGESEKYLEFDIYLSANNNDTYLDAAEIVLSYNQFVFAFSSNIVASGNVEITRGSAISSVSDYANPVLSDLNGDFFKISIATNSNIILTRTQATTLGIELCHVRMEIEDCGSIVSYQSDLAFVNHESEGKNQAFYTLIPNEIASTIEYDNLIHVDPSLQFEMCKPQITNYTESTIAGNESRLTIEGLFFGEIPGKISLENLASEDVSTAGHPNEFTQFDNFDLSEGLITWQDNYIDIVLPGRVYDYVTDLPFNGKLYSNLIPKSGRFEVENFASFTSELEFLTIPYALESYIEIDFINHIVLDKKRSKITTNSGDGILNFQVQQEVLDNERVKDAVCRALATWRNSTGISWEITSITPDIAVEGDNNS